MTCLSTYLCLARGCGSICPRYWFFFFKQKTAYEMRISDWSSDVCSSDLQTLLLRHFLRRFPYQQFPDDYYCYLRGDIDRDELYRNHREELQEAKKSALQISLGPDSHAEVKRIISRKLKGQQIGRAHV